MTHPPAAVCGRRHSLLQAGLGAALLPLAPLAVRADAYPSRPITLVVPFPAGGSVDLIGRIYAERLAKVLGVSVIIENRDGAGGSIGSQRVARAKADGYTLVASSQSSHLANPLMHSNLGYDPIQDFSAISQLSRSLNALVVHPDVPARTLTEFVAHLKANPDQLHFGTAGVGSMGQLNAELFKSTLGVKAVHVPYRGGGPLISGLLSNQVQFMLDNLAPMLPYIQSGKLRAWRSPRRASGLPARRADLRRTWSSDAQHDLVDRAGGARRHARRRAPDAAAGRADRRPPGRIAADAGEKRRPAARRTDAGPVHCHDVRTPVPV